MFEGIDGSGTTTQCRLLSKYTEDELGCSVINSREPGGTSLAERVRNLVLDPSIGEIHPLAEMFLCAASRAQHVRELIEPALRAGNPVLCDRFTSSSLAYQGYGRRLDLKLVDLVNKLTIGGVTPDFTIYFDLPVEVAQVRKQRRGGSLDRLEQVSEEFQERVRQGYREIATENPEVSLLLDATCAPEELAKKIRAELWSRWPRFPLKN